VTLQNRVRPTGEIVADPGRGLLMGNRGCLHRPDRTLGAARWRSKLWICCSLTFKDVRRDVMPPGRWTALFFLDEATALAAGHRPCAYCRRAEYTAFTEAWRTWLDWRGEDGAPRRPSAGEMDARLHTERVEPRSRRQRTHPAIAEGLPDGVMVRRAGVVGLLLDGRLRSWSFDGYGVPEAEPVPASETVELLTPPSTVAVLAAGYRPLLHPSATTGTEHR
jgi:hypothetical protein